MLKSLLIVGDYLDIYPSVQIKSIGGDPINTKDMVIKFTWTAKDAEGNDKDYSSVYSGNKKVTINGVEYELLNVIPTSFSDPYGKFGSVVLENGKVLQTPNLQQAFYQPTESDYGKKFARVSLEDDESFKVLFGDDAYTTLKKGQIVNVVIMYKDYTIYNKEVTVL